MSKRTKALLKFALLMLVLCFVAYVLAKEIRGIKDWSAFHPNWGLVLLAATASLGINSVQIISYRSLLRGYGARPTWTQMAAISWVPALGKYIPGKVAAIGGAVMMLRRFGVSTAVALGVVLVMDALPLLAGLIVSAPLFYNGQLAKHLPGSVPIAAAVIVGGIVCLHPAVFGRLIDFALRKTGNAPLARRFRLVDYAVPMLCGFAQWLFAGTALWLMLRAFTPLPLHQLPLMIATSALAMTGSYLAFFSPGGLGVRETIYLVVLRQLLPDLQPGTIPLVILSLRAIQTLTELTLAGIGWRMQRVAAPSW